MVKSSLNDECSGIQRVRPFEFQTQNFSNQMVGTRWQPLCILLFEYRYEIQLVKQNGCHFVPTTWKLEQYPSDTILGKVKKPYMHSFFVGFYVNHLMEGPKTLYKTTSPCSYLKWDLLAVVHGMVIKKLHLKICS